MATTVVNIKTRARFDVYVGRYNLTYGLRSSKWANPFKIGRDGTREEVIEKYRRRVLETPSLMADLGELRGRVLGCWCKPAACHGDVLAELADALPD
jgi:hypothetical protein